MPTYDYNCSSCGHKFEQIKKIAERETAECPECGEEAKQVISAPLVMLDGTDPTFPGAYNAWHKKRKGKLAREQKQEAN